MQVCHHLRKFSIIITLWILWIASIIAIFFGVYKYIDQKKISLRSELRDNIATLFQGQSNGASDRLDAGFFYTQYSNYPVRHYTKVSKPPRPKTASKIAAIYPKIAEQINDQWEQDYGDISSLYELNWGDEYPNDNDEGWNIIRVYCGGPDEEYIQTNTIFPYKVGLKRTKWDNFYTVEQAVSEAYTFFTTNSKSRFANRHKQGNANDLWKEIYRYCDQNEFYFISASKSNAWISGTPIYIPKNKSYDEAERVMPYENGSMHNGYYRVYIAATQDKVFGISEKNWAIDANRNKLLLWWCAGVSVLFILIIVPLTIKQVKTNKKKSETLYQRLVRLCNPKIFIDNYDKEKVEKANLIYKRLLETNPDDNEALKEIQMQASSELGINFIEEAELEDLKEKVNPKRFFSPYNAEKVSLANELYAVLSKDNLTYGELMEVKEKSKLL